jgi:hypothetical protein
MRFVDWKKEADSLIGIADSLPIIERYQNHELKDRKSVYDDIVAPRTDKHGGYHTENGIVVAQTQQCPHCQKHWVCRKGSGEVRGWCWNCSQATCGKKECHVCLPWAKRMEQMQKEERKKAIVDSYLIGG